MFWIERNGSSLLENSEVDENIWKLFQFRNFGYIYPFNIKFSVEFSSIFHIFWPKLKSTMTQLWVKWLSLEISSLWCNYVNISLWRGAENLTRILYQTEKKNSFIMKQQTVAVMQTQLNSAFLNPTHSSAHTCHV